MRYILRIIRAISIAVLIAASLPPSAHAELRLFAHDDASNYTNWGVAGLNEGEGFNPWVFHADNNPPSYYAGGYLANSTEKTTLNTIQTGPGGNAWGIYANGGGPADFPRMAAFRGFGFDGSVWASRVEDPGDTIKLSMENGTIGLDASFGFTLRAGNSDFSQDDFNTSSRFEFGLYSGSTAIDSNYSIWDGTGKVDTGVPWISHTNGLDLAFTLTSTNTYELSIYDATSPSTLLTNINSTLLSSGPIDSLALFNRRGGTAQDVFFNKLEIWKIVWPTTFILK